MLDCPTVGRYEHEPERDYVYGPDYVDEFIAQIDPALAAANGPTGPIDSAAVAYYLQDANYNVVALTGYTAVGTSGDPAADIVTRQYTYSPYGTIVATESLAAHPSNSVGFQGLLFVNFDDPGTSNPLAPDAPGSYYVRNRFYDPILSRFIQRDPNATGLPLVLEPAFGGSSLGPEAEVINIATHYSNGLNTFAFGGGNPVIQTDPMGLFFSEAPAAGLLIARDFDAIWDSIVGNGKAYLGVQGAATFGGFWGENVAVLPKGALGAAGLSMGFSDFADFYAEQVMSLPVDGVLAGMGGFGKIAAVGSASGKGSRFARLRNAARLGKVGESIAGVQRNTRHIDSLTGTAKFRVPDELTKTTLREVKNVGKLSLTNQLRDYLLFAEWKGLTFILEVRHSTRIAGPLQRIIDEGRIVLRRTLP